MILITGDSWACGEWSGHGDPAMNIAHAGLAQYLRDLGHVVINLGKCGGSNLESASRVADFLSEQNGFSEKTLCVIVFQTEWTRDLINLWNINEFEEVNYDYTLLKSRLISRFYIKLSETACNTRVPIYLVGGCSDTLWFDDITTQYPGLNICCQSWTNLLLHGNHRTQSPVLSRFGSETQRLIPYGKSKMDHSSVKCLLDDLDLAQIRTLEWGRLFARQLFLEDRTHPNRQAHKILFDHLISEIPEL